MTTDSLNRIQRWIRNLHWLDIPNLLAVRDDGLVTAQITTFGERCQTSFAELVLVEEDSVYFFLGFTVRVIICHDKVFVVSHIILLYIHQVIFEFRINFPKSRLVKNLGQHLLQLLGILLLLSLLLIVIMAEKECGAITHKIFNSLIGTVFWT